MSFATFSLVPIILPGAALPVPGPLFEGFRKARFILLDLLVDPRLKGKQRGNPEVQSADRESNELSHCPAEFAGCHEANLWVANSLSRKRGLRGDVSQPLRTTSVAKTPTSWLKQLVPERQKLRGEGCQVNSGRRRNPMQLGCASGSTFSWRHTAQNQLLAISLWNLCFA